MKYFGTDGIRGEVYKDLTLTFAYKLGIALDSFNSEIVVGIDPRYSSIDLAKALIKGIKTSKVRFAGIIPTSGLMYYSLNHQVVAVMITASHNLYRDNGFKIIDKGIKLSENKQIIIETLIDEQQENYVEDKSELKIDENILNEYLKLIDKHFVKTNKKIMFDAANGCYSEVLKKYYLEKDIINCHPDGFNINDNCGSTNVTELIKKVKNNNYDYGIAFDGDGDRLIVVDNKNRIYHGDFLVYLLAVNLKQENKLLNNTVVLSEVSNPGILEKLTEKEIQYIITPVGDINIFKAMANGYILGGEPSGHIINKEILPFGDGLLNAFYFIDTVNKININEEINKTNLFYSLEYNLKYNTTNKINIEKISKKIIKYNNQNQTVVIRKSGTEKVIRIVLYQRYKTKIEKNLKKIIKVVFKCIKKN